MGPQYWNKGKIKDEVKHGIAREGCFGRGERLAVLIRQLSLSLSFLSPKKKRKGGGKVSEYLLYCWEGVNPKWFYWTKV